MAPFFASRRRFLKTSAWIAAGAALPDWFLEAPGAYAAPARPLSPNDRPGIALIGCGGMGRGDGRNAANYGNVLAVCDVDEKQLEQAAKMFPGARKLKDFRNVMDLEDVHVVVNATPDHWHTLINIAAMRTNKDVYSEKPLTLTIAEGQKLVQVGKETGRILQTGSQQRSDARFRLACELVRNGRLGKLKQIITSLPAGRHGGPFPNAPVPPELDWDLWLGQAPKVPYVKERCHSSFRYWYDYSGGTLTDWGAHHNDIALWALGLEHNGPVTIQGRALVQPVPGGYTAASQYRVEYTYANGVTHTCQTIAREDPSGRPTGQMAPGELPNGVKFDGSEGWIFVSRSKIEANRPESISDPLPSNAERLYVSNNHMENFFDCVRSRQKPICDAETGHRSVSVCHLGVIAIRLGRKLKWDPANERFVGDKEADQWLAREMRKPWSYDAV
jgi:predicted dehydrogenase